MLLISPRLSSIADAVTPPGSRARSVESGQHALGATSPALSIPMKPLLVQVTQISFVCENYQPLISLSYDRFDINTETAKCPDGLCREMIKKYYAVTSPIGAHQYDIFLFRFQVLDLEKIPRSLFASMVFI